MGLLERFASKFNKADGCWLWTGATTKWGYGSFTVDKTRTGIPAHRISYETFVGEIPEGFDIDHLCRNKLCVNPDHLEAVTRKENLLRADNPIVLNGLKEECKHGHPFTEENTYYPPKRPNQRYCRSCSIIRSMRYQKERILLSA